MRLVRAPRSPAGRTSHADVPLTERFATRCQKAVRQSSPSRYLPRESPIGNMRPLRIGIDVGSRVVKVAWTTAARGGGVTWHCQTRCRTLADSPESLITLLRQLLHPLVARRYQIPVAVGVCESHVRQRALQTPSLRQLPHAIEVELPRLFPFESVRCRYAYHLLSQQPTNAHLTCTLQIAACDAEVLDRDLHALWHLGWVPTHAAPAALALVALAKAQGQLHGEAVLLIDVGAQHSTLVLVANDQIVFAREVTFGSEALTDALMGEVSVGETRLQCSWEEAEQLKRDAGIPDTQQAEATSLLEGRLPVATYAAMIQPVLEQWLGEIQRTIAFSAEEHPEAVPQRLLLSGGGSQLCGLDRWLATQLGLPVQMLTVQSLLGEANPACAVACGLLVAEEALRINLLPDRSRQRRRTIRGMRGVIAGFIIALLALWLGIADLASRQAQIEREFSTRQQQWKTLQPVVTLAQTVEAHASLLNTLSATHGTTVGWLSRLAEGFPYPVRLTALAVDAQGQITMAGQAQTRQQTPEASVSEFVMWLEQQQLCHDVVLGETTRDTSTPLLIVTFTLTCQQQ